MTFDEITAERKRIFDQGRIELVVVGGVGRMRAINFMDASAHYHALEYNHLAELHHSMTTAAAH